MNKNHHAMTMEATLELLQMLSTAQPNSGFSEILQATAGQAKPMQRWVVQPDEIEDVYVPDVLVDAIIDKVSKATSFQHFAYCGSMGTLRGGNATVEKFEGYCWDCDPFLTWYEELANASWANVRYRPDPSVPAEIMAAHPAGSMVSGTEDWDDQKYISALDLAEFYGNRALELRHDNRSVALQSACFAIHMLHDMTIPQHVLCTIEHGHTDFEDAAEKLWQAIFSARSPNRRQRVIADRLGQDVLTKMAALSHVTSFRKIGEHAVEQTLATLITDRKNVAKPCKDDVYQLTALGIACTVKALELFVKTAR